MSSAPDHPRLPFPPPVAFLAALVAALVLNLLIPLRAPWPGAVRIAGLVLALAGFTLAALAFSSMAREGTSPDAGQPSAALITRGPYRFTRNPIYMGFALAYLGFTLLAGTLWGLVLMPVLILVVTRLVIVAEEKYLAARFGKLYADYSGRVRRWL